VNNQEEESRTDYDVIIVGAGMIGLALALALSETTELSIGVIDHQDLNEKLCLPKTFNSRVSALTEASYRFLDNLGVWSKSLLERLCLYDRMEIWDAEGIGRVTFNAAEAGFTQLGWIAENGVIIAGLLAKIKKSRAITLLDKTWVTDVQLFADHAIVQSEECKAFTARLLIAADGAQSRIRHWIGMPVTEKDCLHHAIVCTIQTSKPHYHTARQVFLNSGPLAFLPLPWTVGTSGNERIHHYSVVWSITPEKAEQMMHLSEKEFCRVLASAGENVTGPIQLKTPRICIPLKQRHAKYYVKGGVVLVGDAAHTLHPLAGQGVNLGFLDVATLTEEITKVLQRGAELKPAYFVDRYQQRRQFHNGFMLSVMDGFQHLFNSNELPLRWMRNTGMQFIDKQRLLKKIIIRQATGMEGDIPELMKVL